MRKMLVPLCLLALLAPAAFAKPPGERPGEPDREAIEVEKADLALRELSALLEPRQGSPIGELKVADVRALLAEASVRMQELQFVAETRAISRFMPGAGHLKVGDKGTGAVYLAADLGVLAGTIAGAYALLPQDVQFSRLDYFNDSFQEIQTAWKDQSLLDYLPSIGVLAGGFVVHAILGHFAAESAGRLAVEKIRDGSIKFVPYAAADRLGLGLTWKPQ